MRWTFVAALLACACDADRGAIDAASPADLAVGDTAAVVDLGACRAAVVAAAPFGAPVVISDPVNAAYAPTVAASGASALVAWHEFPPGGKKRVAYVVVAGGCVGPIVTVADGAESSLPWAVATQAGFYLVYQGNAGGPDEIHGLALDAAGAPLGAPERLSAAGAYGTMARAASVGDDVAIAWTDGARHWFARRGPVEAVAATMLSTTPVLTSQLQFPRVGIGAGGDLFFAWRDGPQSSDTDVFLARRPKLGALGAAANVSGTSGYLSDDVALAVEPDGAIDVVWVEQDPVTVTAFEATWARRSAAGALGSPAYFGAQDAMAWTPSVVAGLKTVWRGGSAGIGPLFYADGATAPVPILAGQKASGTALARTATGALRLAFSDDATPRRVLYAEGP